MLDSLVDYLLSTNKHSVYIHFDKKTNIKLSEFKGSDNLKFYSKFKVYWGSYNMIKATNFLLSEAFKNQHDYYLLISGQDIPIKSLSEIEDFLEKSGCNFISNHPMPFSGFIGNGGLDRISYYYGNVVRNLIEGNHFEYYYSKINRSWYLILRKLMIIFKQKRKIPFALHCGTQWFNLNHETVGKMLEYIKNNPKFNKVFKNTACADEVYYQTLILNNFPEVKTINDPLRYIDWKKGPEKPRIIRMDDYANILSSNALFARKFSSKIDNDIIDKIYNSLKS